MASKTNSVTVTLPSTLKVSIGNKGETVVDVARIIAEAGADYFASNLLNEGLDRILGDAAAGKTGDDAVKAALRKVESWYKGESSRQGPKADPILRIMRVLAQMLPGQTRAKVASATMDDLAALKGWAPSFDVVRKGVEEQVKAASK